MARVAGAPPVVDLAAAREIRSVLVVRLKALGDIALSLPIVAALREAFPAAKILYLCRQRYADALAGETGLDGVIAMQDGPGAQAGLIGSLRRERFDLAIDLIGSPRSAIITLLSGARLRIGMDVGRHRFCYHRVVPRVVMRDGSRVKCYTLESNLEIVRSLGLSSSKLRELDAMRALIPLGGRGARAGGRAGDSGANEGPDAPDRYSHSFLKIGFPAAAPERTWAREYARSIGGGKLAGIVPGAVYRSKSWPEENFAELASLVVRELDLVPIVLWGPGEEGAARRIAERAPVASLAPPMGIARLGALIGELRVLIGPDSGPKHLAVIQGIPTVTIFGPTDPAVWDPMTSMHRVLHRGLACAPCRDRDCRENRCMTETTPRDAVAAAAAVLGKEER